MPEEQPGAASEKAEPDSDKGKQEPTKEPEEKPQEGDTGKAPEPKGDELSDREKQFLKDKQDANHEAQGYREALDAVASALGTTRQELSAETAATILADAEFGKQMRERLGDIGDKDPTEYVGELVQLKPEMEKTNTALQELVTSSIESVPEEWRDLVPTDKPLADQLAWLNKFQQVHGQEPRKLGSHPPRGDGEEPTPTITPELRQRADRYGRTPEEQLQIEEKAQRFKTTGSPGGLERLFGTE